jgi:hypothetical protein
MGKILHSGREKAQFSGKMLPKEALFGQFFLENGLAQPPYETISQNLTTTTLFMPPYH